MLIVPLLTALLLSTQGEPGSGRKEPSAPFELTMEGSQVVHARAVNAPLSLVARRLSETLKVPVKVPAEQAKTLVSFRAMKSASLSELLLQVTSSPLVDTQEAWGADPKLVGIVLGGDLTTASPDEDPSAAGVMVEGHTDEELTGEDGAPSTSPKKPAPAPSKPAEAPEEAEGPFLRVSREEGGRVSVRAREQALGTIIFQIAQTLGVRFDMRVSEAPMVSDLAIPPALPSELPGILGPGAGLLVRRNIATGEERALRFFLDPEN